MADLSDVENALREAVQAVRDTAFPGISVYRGWPAAKRLDDIVQANGSQDQAVRIKASVVTVFPREGFGRNVTRYPDVEIELPGQPPSLTVAVSGEVATFAGACSQDQIAGVQVGTTAWVTRCTAGSTPATVAAALATVSGGTAAGAVLTLSGLLAARTARDTATIRETRRQEQQLAVTVWCAEPSERDRISGAIDAGLSDVTFLTLADGSAGRITWGGTHPTDRAEIAGLYRRDLIYTVDYPTTIRSARTPVLFGGAVFSGQGALHIESALPPVTAAYTDGSGSVVLDAAGNLVGTF